MNMKVFKSIFLFWVKKVLTMSDNPKSKASIVINELTRLAQFPQTALVSICGRSASGKSTLAQALSDIPNFGAKHAELDWWIREPTATRRAFLEQAREQRDEQQIDYWKDSVNFYDWEKAINDIHFLLKNGSLDLKDVYDKTAGELTGHFNRQVSQSAPHLVILSGSPLLHPPIRTLAHYAIQLSADRQTLEERRIRRDGYRKTLEQLESNNLRLHEWGERYFGRFGNNASITLDEYDVSELYTLINCRRSQSSEPAVVNSPVNLG
jgi:uridine kinase